MTSNSEDLKRAIEAVALARFCVDRLFERGSYPLLDELRAVDDQLADASATLYAHRDKAHRLELS